MTDQDALAEPLTIDAWTGSETPSSALHPEWWSWAVKKDQVEAKEPLPAEEVDLRDWQNPEVGWGLVLPDNEDLSFKDRATAIDAAEPLQELVEVRKGPVLRYVPDQITLWRYYADGSRQPLETGQSNRGVGKGRLPQYLLIAASPKKIPWYFQYLLNTSRFVGRLDLTDEQLKNYVSVLKNNWSNASVRNEHPVIWATDDGHPQITWLMRHSIAEPIRERLSKDSAILNKVRHFAGGDATREKLRDALAEAERKPAFILTTSHGMTGPPEDPQLMARSLGYLVDDRKSLVSPEWLLERWQPDGAIWYAHACCSAGADSQTFYKGLVEEGGNVEKVLLDVAALGAQVAPLPTALLGTPKPLRAFIGHVEPTFNWTLRDPDSEQVLTASLRETLYQRMHSARPEPVGMAFEPCFRNVGQLLQKWVVETGRIADTNAAKREAARKAAFRLKLTGLDRQSFVILGDPTVTLPPWNPSAES